MEFHVEVSFNNLTEIDQLNIGENVLVSNVYAKAGKRDDAITVRKLHDSGLKK